MAGTNGVSEWTSSMSGLPSYEEYLKEARQPRQDLGKNDFLLLLTTQLKYQDPMEPVKDSDFIAQMAQFTSLEQLTNLNTTMTNSAYYNFAGKYVYAAYREGGQDYTVQGVVDRIMQLGGLVYAQVGDSIFEARYITQVYDKELMMGTNPLLDTANLIGREVSAKIIVPAETEGDDSAAEPVIEVVTGVVTRVAVEDGSMVAYLDGSDTKKVPVSNIYDIKDVSGASKPPVVEVPEELEPPEGVKEPEDPDAIEPVEDIDGNGTEGVGGEPDGTEGIGGEPSGTEGIGGEAGGIEGTGNETGVVEGTENIENSEGDAEPDELIGGNDL